HDEEQATVYQGRMTHWPPPCPAVAHQPQGRVRGARPAPGHAERTLRSLTRPYWASARSPHVSANFPSTARHPATPQEALEVRLTGSYPQSRCDVSNAKGTGHQGTGAMAEAGPMTRRDREFGEFVRRSRHAAAEPVMVGQDGLARIHA